ncbi:MAG: amidohydrolase family protein [Pseudomonadota bacterium]
MPSPGYLPWHASPKRPDTQLPAGACDAHCHVFGPANTFPFAPTSTYEPVDASAADLFALHKHLGIDRSVIVQASCHGTDNAAMADALARGGDNYRGVAVVADRVSEHELQALHDVGVRGVRFNFVKRLGGGKPLDYYRPIIDKIKALNWSVVVYLEAPDLPELAPFFLSMPVPVVIDHMGRVPVEEGTTSESYKLLAWILEHDKFWVKISCPERLSKLGPPYTDVDAVARGLLDHCPDRILWGTDWPHPNMKSHMPDDGLLVDRLVSVCQGDAALLKRVLVDNPTRLYWT